VKKTIGKVVEVWIPEQYQDEKLLDVMDRNQIAFRVITDQGEKEIVTDQNEWTSNIMKEDTVMITEQVISGQYYIDIELYEDDYDEE
jgi:hypothetical protein